MDKGKKIGAIAIVGAMALTYGIVAASASTSGTPTVDPLTVSQSSSIPTTTTPIVPLIPISGALGSNQATSVGNDDLATETADADSSVSENSNDGDDDSAVSDNSVSSNDDGDDDSAVSDNSASTNDEGDSAVSDTSINSNND